MLTGLERRHLTVGIEVSGLFQIAGPATLGFALGWLDFGKVTIEGNKLRYRSFPISLLGGVGWHWGRFSLAGMVGFSVLLVYVEHEEPLDTEGVDVSFGLTAELYAGVKFSEHIGLGLTLRPLFVLDRASRWSMDGATLYERPRALLSTHLAVTFLF